MLFRAIPVKIVMDLIKDLAHYANQIVVNVINHPSNVINVSVVSCLSIMSVFYAPTLIVYNAILTQMFVFLVEMDIFFKTILVRKALSLIVLFIVQIPIVYNVIKVML